MTEPRQKRVQGPTFIMEQDSTQNNVNHVHLVWKDFKNDFGEDLLKSLYECEAGAPGKSKK